MKLNVIFLFIWFVCTALVDNVFATNRYWQRRNPFATGIPPNAGIFEQPINHIGSDLAQLARRRGPLQQSMLEPYQPPLMASQMPNPPEAIAEAEQRLAQRRPALNLAGRLGGDLSRPPISDGGPPPFEIVERDLARLAARHSAPENQKFGPTEDIIRASHIQPAQDFGAQPPQSMPFVPHDSLLAGRRAEPEGGDGGPVGPPPVTSPITENPDAAPYLYSVFNNVGLLESRRRHLRGRNAPMGVALGGRRDILPWFRDSVVNRNFHGGIRNNPLLEQRSFIPGRPAAAPPMLPMAPRSPAQPGLEQMMPLMGRGGGGGAGYGLSGAQAYASPNSIAPVSYPVPDLYRACGFGGEAGSYGAGGAYGGYGGGGGGGGGCPYIYSGAHVAETVAPVDYGYGGRNKYNNDNKQLQNINLAEYGGPTTNINPSGGGGYGNNNGGGGNNNNYSSRQISLYLSRKANKNRQTVSARNDVMASVHAQPANQTKHEIINFPQPHANQTGSSSSVDEPSTTIQQQLSMQGRRHTGQKLSSRRRHHSSFTTDDENNTRTRYSTLIARLDRTVRRRSLAGGPKLAFDMPRYNFRDILCPAFNNDVIGSVRASLVDKGRRVKNGETYFLRYSLPNFTEGGLKIDPISGDISVAGERNKNGRFNLKFGDPPLVVTVLASLNKLSGEKFAQIFVPVAQATAKVVVECL